MTESTVNQEMAPTQFEAARIHIFWLLRTEQYAKAEAELEKLRQMPDCPEHEQYANDAIISIAMLMRGRRENFPEAYEGLRKAYFRSLTLRNNNAHPKIRFIAEQRYWLMLADCLAFRYAPSDHASNLAAEIIGTKTSRTGMDCDRKHRRIAWAIRLLMVPDLRKLIAHAVLYSYRLK